MNTPALKVVTGGTPPPGAPVLADGQSENFLAQVFALRRCDELKFVPETGLFRRYERGCWRDDVNRLTEHEIGEHCRDESISRPMVDVRRMRKWSTTSGVSSFIKVHRLIAARLESFDADPYLLGVQNGVVNLRTGELLPHTPALMISRMCRVECAPKGARPRKWIRALLRIMRGNRGMVRYLQRLLGYCLSGDRRHHVVAFFYGGGGNGKSTVVETVVWLLGGYAASAPMETFEEPRGERHPTELARLFRVRLVTASENSHARRLHVELLKRLTGGDRIAARLMRQDFFEFQPEFVPILVGNHKPRLPSVDDGIARRLHFVPFDVKFDPPDTGLGAALRDDGAAILRWLVDGCMAVQKDGIRPPEAVQAATREYLDEQDVIGQFIAEAIEIDDSYDVLQKPLHIAYTVWARGVGAPDLSSRALADDLNRRGFRQKKVAKGKCVLGLRLRQSSIEDLLNDGMTE